MTSESLRHPSFPFSLLGFWILRTLPVAALIGGMIFLIQIVVCGVVHDNENIKAMMAFINLLPSIVLTALGGEVLQSGNIAALVAIGYQHPFVLILFMVFAVAVPTGLLPGEVQKGTMELILSRSVTKTQVYVCAGMITVCGMFALVLLMFLGTVVATGIFKFSDPVPLRALFKVAVNGGMIASAVGAISLLMSAIFTRRNTAVGVTIVFLVINYFIWLVAAWWPAVSFLAPVSLFHYVDGARILTNPTWPIRDICVLLSIMTVSILSGGIIWHRRDLPLG